MIRFKNTRTGREVAAKNGKDVALMVKIEQDRRTGAELAKASLSPEQGMAEGLSPIRRCGKPA